MTLKMRFLVGVLLAAHALLDQLGVPPWLTATFGLAVAELWVFAGSLGKEDDT